MSDPITMFFTEVWLHRRNRFIAVGGVALFLLFLMHALKPVPWVPESLKQTIGVLFGLSILATTLLMLYYVLKFVLLAVVWLFKRVFGSSKREDQTVLGQRNSAK